MRSAEDRRQTVLLLLPVGREWEGKGTGAVRHGPTLLAHRNRIVQVCGKAERNE